MKIYPSIKRFCDIVLSAAAMIILLPLLLILCAACAVDTKASPIFLQDRIGQNSKMFKIIKFRTMKKSAPSSIPARDMANSEEFVSRFGTFMRRTGADELPQLLNIFAGQMSFVGPRPLMTSEKVLHRERAARGVYRVRPGLAGLAQINCEKIESVKDKAELDAEYVEKMSFSFDVRLFFKTFVIFLRGRHVDEHFSSPSE